MQLVTRNQAVSVPARMLREVRKAEAAARDVNHGQDSGTGQTIIKLQRHQPPLATLVAKKAIGATELQAADQIALAVKSVAMGGHPQSVDLNKMPRGRHDADWPAHVAEVVRNYQKWQNHWSDEWKRTRNPMADVIRDTVIYEQPMSVTAAKIRYGRKRTERAIICGLRHYAAWANLVVGIQRQAWIAAAQQVFDRRLAPTSN